MASFPTSVVTFGYTAAAGKALPYDVVQKLMDETVAVQTAFVGGTARVSAYHNTTQTINDSIVTALNLNSEDFDVGVMHDTAVNNTRVTIPANNAGIYLIIGATQFAPNATGYRLLYLRKNGSDLYLTSSTVEGSAAGAVIQVITLASLAVGDYLELAALQNSGGALAIGSANRATASLLQVARLW